MAGNWLARVPAAISKDPIAIRLTTHRVTRVRGTLRVGGKDVPVDEGAVHGERLEFRTSIGGRTYEFSGMVKPGSIEGTLEGAGLKAPWSAALAK